MKRFFLIYLICPLAFAATLDEANALCRQGNYQAAAEAYEEILTEQGPRASVFYNLGNARQQLKQHGPAILAYERAKLLAPRNPDLAANLTLARKAAAAFEEPRFHPRVDAALGYLSRNEWSWLVAGAALILGALALVAGAVKLPRRGRKFVVVAACLAGLAAAVGATALYLRRGEAERGVVLSENATVRLSPFADAEALGTPGPGRMVRLGERQRDFIYVEVPESSLRGWLAAADVAAITPDEAADD